MGVGLVPVYDGDVPKQARYMGDGKGLAREYEVLNGISARADLPPLGQFVSGDDRYYEHEFGDDRASWPAVPELTYHPSGEGVRAVEGLLREIGSNAESASLLADPAYTVEELEELARSLRAADEAGVRFCLSFW